MSSCVAQRDNSLHFVVQTCIEKLRLNEPLNLAYTMREISEAFSLSLCLIVVSLYLYTLTNTLIIQKQMTPICTQHLSACDVHWWMCELRITLNHCKNLKKIAGEAYLFCAQQSVLLYGSNIYLWALDFCDLPHVQSIRTLLYIRASFEHLIGHKKHLWGELRLTFN